MRRAADRGLAVLEHYRATLGATDLRAGASTRSITLAEIGLRLALEDGTAAAALCWVERARAIGLLYRPVRPPADAGLGRDLAELRRAAIDERDAVRSGRAAGGPRRRQVELERQVRDRSRISGGAGGVGRSVVDVGQLRRRLGDTAMVVYFALDGRLRAVTVAPTLGLYDLGPAVPVLHELDLLPFFLRRLAWQHGNGRAEVVQAEGRRDGDRTQPTIEGEVHDHRGVPEATAQLAHVDHGPADATSAATDAAAVADLAFQLHLAAAGPWSTWASCAVASGTPRWSCTSPSMVGCVRSPSRRPSACTTSARPFPCCTSWTCCHSSCAVWPGSTAPRRRCARPTPVSGTPPTGSTTSCSDNCAQHSGIARWSSYPTGPSRRCPGPCCPRAGGGHWWWHRRRRPGRGRRPRRRLRRTRPPCSSPVRTCPMPGSRWTPYAGTIRRRGR